MFYTRSIAANAVHSTYEAQEKMYKGIKEHMPTDNFEKKHQRKYQTRKFKVHISATDAILEFPKLYEYNNEGRLSTTEES